VVSYQSIRIEKLSCRQAQRKVERQVKVLIKNLAIFLLFPSKEFLPISFKIQLLETSGQFVLLRHVKCSL
jgi:hypothetical protein